MKKVLLVALGAALISPAALADHSWSTYHWARTSSSFDLVLVNSTTTDWDPFVTQAVGDWASSGDLNMVEEEGSTGSRVRRKCNAPSGKVRICNLAYGFNGWVGIAGISIDSNGHITKGYTKLNDSYFSLNFYNQPNWKQSVTCQELGHDLGLGHQDENFNNETLLSCMDYQDPPFEYPNTHDYEQLGIIYGHIDSYDSYSTSGDSGGGGSCNSPPGKGCNKAGVNGHSRDVGWGISLGRSGQKETFMRIDPDGTRHITYVTWAVGH